MGRCPRQRRDVLPSGQHTAVRVTSQDLPLSLAPCAKRKPSFGTLSAHLSPTLSMIKAGQGQSPSRPLQDWESPGP